MWDLIVSVPDHCLSFYFETSELASLVDYARCKEQLFKLYCSYKCYYKVELWLRLVLSYQTSNFVIIG